MSLRPAEEAANAEPRLPLNGVALTLPIAPTLRLRLALPNDAVEVPDSALPTIDVSGVPGAMISLQRGFRSDNEGLPYILAICARAPSKYWAPNVEELVLGRASMLVQGALGGEIERFDVYDIEREVPRFEQRFEGVVRKGGEPLLLRGRHLLGFAGETKDVVLCTVVCTESRKRGALCEALIDAVEPQGAWEKEPPPSLLIQAILLTAEQPEVTLVVTGVVLFAVMALVIARRPRPRP